MAIVKDLTILGVTRALQDIYGTLFHGDITGNADTVDGHHAEDFSLTTHTHYIGTTQVRNTNTGTYQDMTGIGTIYLSGSAGSYREGIRMKPFSNGWVTLLLGGNDLTADSGTSANSWGIFNNNGNFYLSKNGSSSSTSAILSNVSNNWTFGKGNVTVSNEFVGSGNVRLTGLGSATANITDTTELLTSHINGFSESSDSGPGRVYRRPATSLYNYIKSKTDDLYVKKAGDTMTGSLYINIDQDAGLDQNGSLIIGDKAGQNIAIDGNEIMSRNNSTASTLYLQNAGGTLDSRAITNYFSGNVGIGTNNPSQKLHIDGGLAAITNNTKTLTIGSANAGFYHFQGSDNSPFYFSNISTFKGNVYPYIDNTYTLGTSDKQWKNVYTYQATLSVADGTAPLVVTSKTLNTNLNADLLDSRHAKDIVPLVIGTQTASTGAWTGSLVGTGITELYTGLTIKYYLPYAPSGNATLNLTLDNGSGEAGSTTGAINCYYGGNTRLTTHYGAGNVIIMTYFKAGDISVSGTTTAQDRWYAHSDYDSNTTWQLRYYYFRITAGTNGIKKYSLILEDKDGKWQSTTIDSGDGKSKTVNTAEFKIGSPIYYVSRDTDLNANNTCADATVYKVINALNFKYSSNCGTTLVANQPLFFVGTINNNGYFQLDSTTWWTQTIPTTEDNKLYIKIGDAVLGNYQIDLIIDNGWFWFKNGKFQRYYHLADNAINAENANNATNAENAANADKVDNIHAKDIVPLVIGTQSAATGTWTGSLVGTGITELYTGLTIKYYLPYAGSGNATLNLTLDNGSGGTGSTSGNIACYYSGNSRLTTHYGAGNVIIMTYFKAGDISVAGTATTQDRWYAHSQYDSTNTYELRYYFNNVPAGTNGIKQYSLILEDKDGRWQSFTTTSGDGKTKPVNTAEFKVGAPIYHYNGSGNISVGSRCGNYTVYKVTYLSDFRYSSNCGTTLTANQPLFIVGSINDNGYFVLDSTTWWTQTIPTTEDNKLYIKVSDNVYDGYRFSLIVDTDWYWFKDGKFQKYYHLADNAINAENAVNADNADKVDNYHVLDHYNHLYKDVFNLTCQYSSITENFWYVKIITKGSWDSSIRGKMVLVAQYSNYSTIAELQTYGNVNCAWSYKAGSYQDTDLIQKIASYKNSDNKQEIILALKKPVEYSGSTPDGSLKIYANNVDSATVLTTVTLPSGVQFTDTLNNNGQQIFSGNVKANKFIGNLQGNADTATNAANADKLDNLDSTDFVPRKYNTRFYPFIKADDSRSIWHKVTLPWANITFNANKWMMISMELILGGSGYSDGTNGRIYLSYYFTCNTSGVWTAVNVKGIAIGSKLSANGITIKYDLNNPGIFYVKVNNTAYTSFAIENLSANDTAPNYEFKNTTIEAITESNIPSAVDKIVPIVKIETTDGTDLLFNNSTILTTDNYDSYLGYIGTTPVQSTSTDGQHLTGIGAGYFSGDIVISKPNYTTLATGAALNGFTVKTTGGKSISLGVGTGGVNRGIYDDSKSKWMLYTDDTNIIANYGSFLSGSTGTQDIGSSSNYWKNVYTRKVTIDSNTAGGNAHIEFNRADYNYIKLPTNGVLAVSVNGTTGATTYLGVSKAATFPGQNNGTVDLGTSNYHWRVGYINKLNTQNYEVAESTNSRLSFANPGQTTAKGINVGDLLVSNAWADYTNIPTNGAYIKGVIKSGVTGETAPFSIASTTLNTNLNADLLDGEHSYQLRAFPNNNSDILFSGLPFLQNNIKLFDANIITSIEDAPDGLCWGPISSYKTFTSDFIPVTPGELLYGEIWTYREEEADGEEGTLYYGIQRYDRNKKPISANAGLNAPNNGYFVASNSTIPSDGVWHKFSATHMVPLSHTAYNGSDGQGVYYVKLYILVNYSTGSKPTYISGIKLSRNNSTYIPKALTSRGTTATTTRGETYGIVGNGTSGVRIPTRWFVNLDNGETKLKDGMIISFRIPVAGVSTSGDAITIDNDQSHFHQVVYNTNSFLTTHFGVNSVITVQYDTSISAAMYGKYDANDEIYIHNGNTTTSVVGVWRVLSLYDSGNTDVRYEQTIYYPLRTVPTGGAICRYTLCMMTPDGKMTSLTITNNSNGTGKTMFSGYLDWRKVYYWNHTDTYAAGESITRANTMLTHEGSLIDYRYTLNCGTTLTSRGLLYLVGTIDANGFKLDPTTPWACSLPSTDDGKVYIYVGMIYPDSGGYRGTLEEVNTPYWYKDGRVQIYSDYSTISSKVQTITNTTNAAHYLTFVDSNNSTLTDESLYTSSKITFNPNTSNLSITNSSTTFSKVYISNSNGAISIGSSTNRGLYDETNSKWIIGHSQNGKNTWVSWKEGDTAANNLTYKFGVGTGTPTSKLHVVGDIYSTAEQVTETFIRAKNGNIYAGSASTAQCHMQYDNDDECMKFMFD